MMSTMAPPKSKRSPQRADKAKLAAAALLVVGGVAAYYLMGKQADWIRWVALMVLLAGGRGDVLHVRGRQAALGLRPDAWRETQKVVWPSRKEATQMTGYVFAFVVVMALFLWLTDKTLEWVLYDLVLGWKR